MGYSGFKEKRLRDAAIAAYRAETMQAGEAWYKSVANKELRRVFGEEWLSLGALPIGGGLKGLRGHGGGGRGAVLGGRGRKNLCRTFRGGGAPPAYWPGHRQSGPAG